MAEFARREPALAKANGLDRMSVRTLERRAESGPPETWLLACADERWLRRSPGTVVSPEVREALFAVHAECLHRSKVTMRTKERLVHQFVRERYGDDVDIPGYYTLRKIWAEWFDDDGNVKQRYVRSAAAAKAVATGKHVILNRPGQVVALDSTPLPVKLRESVFGEPTSAQLTLALDVYTRSMVARWPGPIPASRST
jgi:hypothetical protein